MDLSWRKVEQRLEEIKRAQRLARTRTFGGIEFRSLGHRLCHNCLHSQKFDIAFGAIIIFNLVIGIIETDAIAANGHAPFWIELSGWITLAIFVFELSVRLYVLAFDFWLDSMNIVDFFLVTLDVFMNVLGLVAGNSVSVSFLRVIRLCKLTRLAKVFHVCPELRLMMAGLLGSVKAIFWGTVLLMFALLVWSIIAVQFIHPLNKDLDHGDCERCPRAYASVFDACLTFSQQIVAGDGWGMVTVTVIEHYPATVIFYAGIFVSVAMAVLNLILGVVVDVASSARDRLKEDMEDEQLCCRLEAQHHILEVCRSLDTDQSGEISKEEIFLGFQNDPTFREALSYMEVGQEDLEILWAVLDSDKSGAVSYDEFVSSCYRLKSSNTHFLLAHIKYYVSVIKDGICSIICNHMVDQMSDVKSHIIAAPAQTVETEETFGKTFTLDDTAERESIKLQRRTTEVLTRLRISPKLAAPCSFLANVEEPNNGGETLDNDVEELVAPLGGVSGAGLATAVNLPTRL